MAVGTQVGAYRLIQRIGEGGMGTVWLAEHTMRGRRAAVKVALVADVRAHGQGVLQIYRGGRRGAEGAEEQGVLQRYREGAKSAEDANEPDGPGPRTRLGPPAQRRRPSATGLEEEVCSWRSWCSWRLVPLRFALSALFASSRWFSVSAISAPPRLRGKSGVRAPRTPPLRALRERM
jgi:serine/threonine protein kinase